MRKELYKMLCDRLQTIEAIKHIDLWNNNVEFLDQEQPWERPAVFVEFRSIKWEWIVVGLEYRAEPEVALHVVTDWGGPTTPGSPTQEESLQLFDLLDEIHATLAGVCGDTFLEFDLVQSDTNHNHEEIVESIETYRCTAILSRQ